MQAYIQEDWDGATFTGDDDKAKKKSKTEMKGRAGNVVPFFPTDW